MAEIQIAFPKVDEGSSELVASIPPAHEGTVGTGLALYAKPTERKTLVCSSLLQGDTLAQAQAEAGKVFPEMLDNTQVFMAYGTQALEGVNSLVDRLMHEVEPIKIKELTALMRGLEADMRGIKTKYNPADPRVLEKYEHWKGGVGRFFGNAKSIVDMLMKDAQSIEHRIDVVGKELKGKQKQLLRNVTYYDELYDENEAEIGKLIYAIGVMELIRDLAAAEAAGITVGDSQMGDRQGEQKAILAEFISNMEIKIAEYKGRLFVAWATSPQMRMMRTLNVGLAERINELQCVAIPTMKGTILSWRLLAESMDAAEMAGVVAAATNDWLVAYSDAAAVSVPKIAEAIQVPTLTPQTVMAMADSISKQADGIIAAVQLGDQRRAELDASMIDAHAIMADASKRVTDELVDRVIERANKPLEIATSVNA